MPPGKRPRILLAVPCERYLPIQFAQSILWAVQDPELEIIPYLVGSTVVHLARSDAIGVVREDKSFDFLCFVDSDQIFSKLTIRRLVTWGVPVVAPVVVQRQGDPIPVAYKEMGRDDKGMWRYESLIGPIVAYLSQFGEKWWDGPTGILPVVPDCIGPSMAVPEEVAAGCNHPLLPCDAVGAGMVLFRRDVLDSLQTDEHGLFCGFASGGEDLDICRRTRAAGWGGCVPGERGWGIFVDRGCFIGHLTSYSRGIHDMLALAQARSQQSSKRDAAIAALPPAVPDLVNALHAQGNGRALPAREWAGITLPGEADLLLR